MQAAVNKILLVTVTSEALPVWEAFWLSHFIGYKQATVVAYAWEGGE